jgi:hypothetical protein
MKKMIISVIVSLIGFAAYAQTGDSTVVFASTVHDFGEIKQNVPQTFSFEFTNTGTEAIVIQKVQPSCGCTTSGWTKEPVPPGKKGYVQATYNAASVGRFSKTLTVVSNGNPASVVLHIRGTVKGT